jgi:hypothetical protein
MSTGPNPAPDAAERQQRINEFLRLLPLTLEVAGLPKSELGRYFNEAQMELRAAALKSAYKVARALVMDLSRGAPPPSGEPGA